MTSHRTRFTPALLLNYLDDLRINEKIQPHLPVKERVFNNATRCDTPQDHGYRTALCLRPDERQDFTS